MALELFKRALGIWSCMLAAGTWIVPVCTVGSTTLATGVAHAAPLALIPGGGDNGSEDAGGWVWKNGANIDGATAQLWMAAAGIAPAPGMILTLDESEGASVLHSVAVDGAATGAEWSAPVGRSASASSRAEVSASLVQTEDGTPGVRTMTVDVAAVLLEVPTLGTEASLLGVQVLIEQEIHLQTGQSQSARFNAVLPLEYGKPYDAEVGPHLALSQLLTGTTTDVHGPTAYPIVYPAPLSIDCRQVHSGSLGCLCDCWRVWHDNRADFETGLWIAIHACKWVILTTAAACGGVCLLTVPSGGSASPLCIACLRTLGAEALLCIQGALAAYVASVEVYRAKRIRCIKSCEGLMDGWDDVEGTMSSAD